jgi:drug/metabolite transporter (DMT)-like permease
VQSRSRERLAVAALLVGATGIGFAPILVRLSEVGPSATAFYRLFFSLPMLWLWMRLETGAPTAGSSRPGDAAGSVSRKATEPRFFVVAGLCFAGDLVIWHWSLRFTTVANSTLLTNCAPFFVMLGAWLLFRERITPHLLLGLALAFAGGAMLVGHSLTLAAGQAFGDGLAVLTAVFYAGYLLTVKHLRRTATTSTIMWSSGLVSCSAFLLVTLLSEKRLLAVSSKGWLALIALALVSHVGGQGLIAFALAHLPASFSAVGLLWQPVVAATLAWLTLGESMSGLQITGGGVVLAGIAVACYRPESVAPPRPTQSPDSLTGHTDPERP